MLCNGRLNIQLFPRSTSLSSPASNFALARGYPDECHLLGTSAKAITAMRVNEQEKNTRVDAWSILEM